MTPTRALSARALAGVAALALSLGGAVAGFVLTAAPASADTINVTNTADDGSTTSLRWVLEHATDGDVVVLTAGATYQLTICNPPAPASAEGSPGWGDVEIDGAVTIQGNGATIEQTCPDRVLSTQSAVTLTDVTITGGNVEGPGGGLFQDSANPVVLNGATFTGNTASGGGGGVASTGDVTVTGSTFSDNHAPGGGDGGGIRVMASSGTTSITSSTFTGNTTNGWGGAFEQDAGSVAPGAAATGPYAVEVVGSTFTGNTADGDGGGALDTESDATYGIQNSTFSANSGGWGGAIGAFGSSTQVDVFGTTFSGNTSADDGGAMHISGGEELSAAASGTSVTVVDSTITANTQGVDGAVNVDGSVNFGYVTMTDNTSTGERPVENESARGVRAQLSGENDAANITAETFSAFGSVVALPQGGPNCEIVGGSADAGYNFSDDPSCGFTATTSKVSTPNDPVLGALANNGGPTETLLPLTGSPLLDAIPTDVCTTVGVMVDQRGVVRPQGTGCDIGAVEVEVVAPAPAVVVTPRFTG